MSEDRDRSAKEDARKEREERLAAALRANLRRRKAGVRERAESSGPTPPDPAALPDDKRK